MLLLRLSLTFLYACLYKMVLPRWRITHRDHFNAYRRGWCQGNDAYKQKQLGYMRAFLRRRRILAQFRLLCAIDLF